MTDRKSTAKRVGSDDNGNPIILRNQDGVEKLQMVAPVVDGEPVSTELVYLTETTPGEYDVETIYDPKTDGPAMVNSVNFRAGWDRIFSKEKQASN
jgi:hypothetical protein